jgi:hypothetical protein
MFGWSVGEPGPAAERDRQPLSGCQRWYRLSQSRRPGQPEGQPRPGTRHGGRFSPCLADGHRGGRDVNISRCPAAEGGLVKAAWLHAYAPNERLERFERVLQSWDTANNATELSDFGICTS